jgi:hypothetical protein
MKASIEDVVLVVSALTEEQQQLLKDTINYGAWGDGDFSFLNEDGSWTTDMMYGYFTNDAKHAGHFSGRKVSAMFRSIYRKLCDTSGIGMVISHCTDWWEDGSGDMLFIRERFVDAFEEWAKQ